MTWQVEADLFALGAVQLKPHDPFHWSSGLKAPIYCDHRTLLGEPMVRTRIAEGLAGLASPLQPTMIAGTSTAGIPWGMLVAHHLSLPFVYVRPEPKAHGLGRQVEGQSCDHHSIVLVEDLISTGGSSLRCVEALRAEGAQVRSVIAIFTYGFQTSHQAFMRHGVPLQTLGTFENLIEHAQTVLGADAVRSLQAWQQDPQAWSEQHRSKP